MSGLPTIHVKLDDGTGTYPTDVTSRVRLVNGISVSSYGRADEFSQPQAASLTFTLDNADGAVTDGTISIEPETPVRLTLTKGSTTVNRFTGKVTALDLGWPGGGEEFAVVPVTAVDPLADLSRRPMRSMLEEEILHLSPSAYYTLGEAEGSKTAGDTSGNQAPPLTQVGTGVAVVFGNGTGPTDGLTAATFAGGKWLANSLTPGVSYSELVAFSRASAPAAQEIMSATAHEFLVLETGGKLSLYVRPDPAGNFVTPTAQSSVSVCDGGVHQAGWSVQSGVGFQFFIDGATTAVADVTAGTLDYQVSGLQIGGWDARPATVNVLTGNASHVAHFDGTVLTSTQAAAIWDDASGALESTDDRLSRLASYAGLTATMNGPSGQLMGAQATSGSSLFDALQAVAAAEGGVLFADGSGGLVMQGRYYRGKKTTADVTLTSDAVDPGTGVTWDTQQKINQVVVTRTGGAAQTVQTAGVTARTEPVYPTSLDLAVDTDDNALAAAQWELAKHEDTAPRLGSVTFDLLTASDADAEALLGMGIGDRLALSLPSQMWATGDYTLEGWTETVTDQTWSLTANLLPWALARAFILDDPVLGVLDNPANPLGY